MNKEMMVAGLLALAGCSASDLFVRSDFKTPSSGGTFNLDRTFRSGQDSGTVGGYAYAIGEKSGAGFRAYAGLLPGTYIAPPPGAGTATLVGTYELATMTGVNASFSQVTGFAGSASGALTLAADFAAQTLTTSSGALTVNGTFNAMGHLDGSVKYGSHSATLDGRVGAADAVGVFHGKSDTSLIAGGFLVKQ